jgi:hypothetical protein
MGTVEPSPGDKIQQGLKPEAPSLSPGIFLKGMTILVNLISLAYGHGQTFLCSDGAERDCVEVQAGVHF